MSRKHIPALDGVRGLAIFLIVLFHCFPKTTLPVFGDILKVTKSMWIGVDLFFVLSGFLITGILMRLKDSEKKYINFYARRTLRIFPLYFFVLFIVFYLLSFNEKILVEIEESAPKQWYFLYSYNIYLMIKNSWPDSYFLAHLWSLSVEEQFYLIWPFMVYKCSYKKLPLLMVSVAFMAVLMKIIHLKTGVSVATVFNSTVGRMDCFALGGLAAYANMHWEKEKVRHVFEKLFYLSGLTLLGYAVVSKGIPLNSITTQVFITPVIALLFSTFIYLVLNPAGIFNGINKVMVSEWLKFLGKYSYGIYIYHWIIMVVLFRLDLLELNIRNPWSQFVLVSVATLLISMLSFHLLEMPFLKLKKYFADE